jgi:signal transduction histidine kinase
MSGAGVAPDRILVVEDNLALADNVAELLEDSGIEVILCPDAECGLRAAEERGFELAILDIGLGGKESGLDLIPKLRGLSSHGEILLMTGNASLQSAIQGIRSGVYAYVQKPFDPEQFITLVRRALAQVALKREKQALAQRLATSEALYRGVVDTAEACILGLDAKGVVRFANRFAAERLAVAPNSLIGCSFFASIEATMEEPMRRAVAQAAAGASVRDQECQHLGSHTVRWTFTPLSSPLDLQREGPAGAGLPTVLCVGLDLTDRLELERRHAEGQAMAAMGTLATSLAHEIRNPLNAARLQLELLLRRAAKAEDVEAAQRLSSPAEIVRSELSRLSSLLDEFLNLARPRGVAREMFPVTRVLLDVASLKGPFAQSVGVALRVEPVEPNLFVRADADKLKQVLINLVGNALEALAESKQASKEVSLSAVAHEQGVLICVTDNGPGLPADVAGSAFRPFVTSKPGGTGLGLAIVAKIVAQHGGWTELVPREAGGTVARCFIPE